MPPSGFIFLEISFSGKSSNDFHFRDYVLASAVNFREHNLNIREPTHKFSVILKKI
jgi:hypothetical protein